ncbi:hypothetical protein PEC18_10230 [Paucibacter sp. O1-1]|nr:hypothetical protein [Paucibacter sp. O1-1]MDA3826218.1 hypothetical protein [Paucibacter sp. O1-1]
MVGTQMVSKGLDFDNVSMVGIFDADRIIHFPEFRASGACIPNAYTGKRTRGATGRINQAKSRSRLANPSQKLLERIVTNDYHGMYESEIIERGKIRLSAIHTRLIKVTVKHIDEAVSNRAAKILAEKLDRQFGGEPGSRSAAAAGGKSKKSVFVRYSH